MWSCNSAQLKDEVSGLPPLAAVNEVDNNLTHCVKSIQIQSFFWSVFSRIRTEYGEIRSMSPYSDQMRENADQKNLRIWTLFTQ